MKTVIFKLNEIPTILEKYKLTEEQLWDIEVNGVKFYLGECPKDNHSKKQLDSYFALLDESADSLPDNIDPLSDAMRPLLPVMSTNTLVKNLYSTKSCVERSLSVTTIPNFAGKIFQVKNEKDFFNKSKKWACFEVCGIGRPGVDDTVIINFKKEVDFNISPVAAKFLDERLNLVLKYGRKATSLKLYIVNCPKNYSSLSKHSIEQINESNWHEVNL